MTIVAIFAYGLKNNRGWKYWVFTILFLAPAGGLIASAFVPENENAKALQAQALDHALEQDAIEACRKRECKDKGCFYMNGQCQGDPIVTSYGQVLGTNYHDLNC